MASSTVRIKFIPADSKDLILDTEEITIPSLETSSKPKGINNQLDNETFVVPLTTGPKELDDILKHLLGEGGFIYRIQNSIIRSNLDTSMTELCISSETCINIIYEQHPKLPEFDKQIDEPDWIRCVAVRGQKILTGSYDGAVRLYKNYNLDEDVEIYKHSFDIITVIKWIDDDKFVVGNNSGKIYLWDTKIPNSPITQLTGNKAAIQSMIILDTILYSADYDGFVCKYDLTSVPIQLKTTSPLSTHNGKKSKKRPSSIIITTSSSTVQKQIEPPSIKAQFQSKINDATIATLLYNQSDECLVAYCWDGIVKSIRPHDLAFKTIKRIQPPITCSDMTEDYLVTGHSNGQVKIWDKKGECIKSEKAHDGWISGIVIDHKGDEDHFVSVGSDGAVKIWDQKDISSIPLWLVKEAKPLSKVLCVEWKDSLLAFGGEDKKLTIHARY